MNKALLIALIFAMVVGVPIGSFYYQKKTSETTEQLVQKTQEEIEIIAKNLTIPWEVAFLPDGSLLFTERPGRVQMIDIKGNLLPSPIAAVPGVKHIGEGGLLGIAVHPDVLNNAYVYLYYTYDSNEEKTLNRVARFMLEDGALVTDRVIVDEIPGAANHNGGRIKFGPDGHLYITTGDAQNPSFAQDRDSLAGKILRVTDEGKAPPGNPFDNLVYSYGHRNPQGLAWDNKGQLWATEHGPQALDELNLIEKGKNYGWPVIQGDEKQEKMVSPIIQSGPDVTWAPSGAVFYEGSIFFGGLRGETLFEYKLADKSLKGYFQGEFGRIREVVLGPDGYLYITTSNTDGRGTPKVGDDTLIKINPKIFR